MWNGPKVGGMDEEVQRIFLTLPKDKLEILFQKYRKSHGDCISTGAVQPLNSPAIYVIS
jgi:hypothetical protein